MTLTSYIFGTVAALLVLLVIFGMFRKRKLREHHALWWLFFGFLNLIAAMFPPLLEQVSSLLGIQVPTNLVFFTGIFALFFVSIQQSSELNRSEERVRILAEEHSLLLLRVSEIENQMQPHRKPDSESSEGHGPVQD